MLNSIITKVSNSLKSDHERTINIKKNIIYSFLIKGFSVAIGYALFPLTMNYVNPSQYGIWLTIASLVAWLNTFDIGLSNGLRNKLAGSLALNEKADIAKYISTTYALLFLIGLIAFALFFTTGSFFNWNKLLHIQNTINYAIWPIILVTLGIFCIQFALQPINSILIATHQPFKSSLIFLSGQLLTLVLTFLLILYTHGTLLVLVLVVGGSPVVMLLLSSLYLFKTNLKDFAPRFRFIDFKSAKSLLNVGGAFFLIQIGALVLYETDNIIITRTLGPNEVTVFNIAYKYFSIITVAFAIFATPYWSAFTDAYAKNDFEWIKHSLKKLRMLCFYFGIMSLILYLLSGIFYRFWIGYKVAVPTLLSLTIAVYSVVQTWTVIHAFLLNGVGKFRVQLILIISTGLINIPLSVYLIKYVGLSGTVIANIIVMLIINVFITYQCKLIINKKARGIWDK
jgi:O-antigen/teichoic acid export membrane protein